MPHIHTDPGQHDHTASAFVIRTDFAEPKLVLHKHKKLGMYLQFGGHIELDENPWQAVSHELLEESGYEMGQLKILQPKDRMMKIHSGSLHPQPVCHNTHNFNDEHFHTDSGYAFITDQEPRHKIGDSESDEIRLVTRQELLEMSTDEVYENIRQIGLFIFDTCLPKWEAVSTDQFS